MPVKLNMYGTIILPVPLLINKLKVPSTLVELNNMIVADPLPDALTLAIILLPDSISSTEITTVELRLLTVMFLIAVIDVTLELPAYTNIKV